MVWWGWFPILASMFVSLRYLEVGWETLLIETGINLSILLLQWVLVVALFSIRKKRFEPVVGTMLGWGDVWFFVVMCLAFSPVNFWTFYLGGIGVITLGYTLMRLLGLAQRREVPLAGGLALLLTGVLFAFWWNPGWQWLSYDLLVQGGGS